MTDTHNPWDVAEHSLVTAEQEWRRMLDTIPDDLAHHVARNRVIQALDLIRDAQDAGFAARARMPNRALAELTRIGEETQDEATDIAYIQGLNQ
jgi:hypothetical protein